MKDLINILKEVINTIDYSINIKSVEVLDTKTFKLNLYCNTNILWIRECLIININNSKYKVKEYNEQYIILEKYNNKSIDIDLQLNKITLNKPTFVHGTIPASDVIIQQDCIDMPLIYLFEIYQIKKNSMLNPIEYVAQNLSLFFLSDYEDEWITSDHYNNNISQMSYLMELFLDKLKSHLLVDEEYILNNGYTIKNRVKLGTFNNNKGNEKGLFNRKLSGIELIINIPFNRNNCNC